MQKKTSIAKKCVITAGGTREYIDLVRYISNESSGKMGFALANEAIKRNLDTVLITTMATDISCKKIQVNSAKEMFDTVKNEITDNCIIFMAAAVSDWRPKDYFDKKIKKEQNQDTWNIAFIKNPDILKYLSSQKTTNQIIVGFSAESNQIISNSQKKLIEKNCDYIVVNDISKSDIGFNSDYNEVYLLDKQGNTTKIDYCLKTVIAKKLFDQILGKLNSNTENCFEKIEPVLNEYNQINNIKDDIIYSSVCLPSLEILDKKFIKNQNNLNGCKILLGITGSIAAYKIPDLIRLYKSYGAIIKIIVTENALKFVSKLTLQVLSENSVEMDLIKDNDYNFEHISLVASSDIIVIAPISANTIAKIAHGICDNLLTTLCCACYSTQSKKNQDFALIKPIIISPAMNCNMFASPLVQMNLDILKKHGFYIIPTEIGSLACGYFGEGRLPDIKVILKYTSFILENFSR